MVNFVTNAAAVAYKLPEFAKAQGSRLQPLFSQAMQASQTAASQAFGLIGRNIVVISAVASAALIIALAVLNFKRYQNSQAEHRRTAALLRTELDTRQRKIESQRAEIGTLRTETPQAETKAPQAATPEAPRTTRHKQTVVEEWLDNMLDWLNKNIE